MSTILLHRGILFFSCLPAFLLSLTAQPQKIQDTAVVKNELKIPADVQFYIDSLHTNLQAAPGGAEKIGLYGKICWAYLGIHQLEIAKQYADSVHLLSHTLKDSAGIMKAAYYYGVIARFRGNHTEALMHLEPNLHYYERKGDSGRVAAVLYQIGIVNSHLGDYEKSLAAYYRLMNIEQKDGNDYSVGYTLNAIGVILKETKKYPDAELLFKKALVIYDTLDEKNDKTYVLVNLGNLYTETHQFEKAKQNYLQALQIYREIGNETGTALSLANIAFLFDKMARYDSALIYHLQGLAIREQLPSKEDLSRSLIGVGLGYSRLRNYDSAIHYSLKALSLVKEIRSKPMLKDVYENLADINASQGNFSKAYNYHVLYSKITDTLLGEQTARQLNELQTKYETAEKDRQIQLLAKEKLLQEQETQRQATLKKGLLTGLLLLGLLVVLLIYIFRQRLKNQKLLALKNNEIRDADYKRQMSELEMKALRAQINPHFLFNCMNSINRMILQGETQNASSYLTKFSKLVRLILENAESPTVSLENEMALLESYIQLEGLRFKGRINYNISIDESIEPESTYLPSMVLQPFVENAIWHGLMHKKEYEKNNIFIGVKEDNDRLLCTIEDNGVGREKAQQLSERSVFRKKSMGMKITEDRLRLLNRENPEQIIRVTDMKDTHNNAVGTRIEINIPVSER
ncbi:tetratricopeptide repeat protein [Agriterribacter sp.]|uniref:tetratricopeptide repeat-containing sensor histidine kinase n=1 Tax=Agriterribacter sp. TaxID=2821509 RepID=UPI002CF62BAF|nr:tetratricopeptide repeat protein [Agriterribacter sp.]HRO47247.1 tetratricopeptide repeat protein [Agriterribacter sp.]HRQ19261.1 tetratricopeptide repeat protein [Agriterribacter sp.]